MNQFSSDGSPLKSNSHRKSAILVASLTFTVAAVLLAGCGRNEVKASANVQTVPTVGTAVASKRPVAQYLTLSSELVPFQEIDVYAKESGFVKELNVDYGSHVKKGQVMGVLEIPELEAQLDEDQAAIKTQSDMAVRASHEVSRAKAQHNVVHMQYDRLQGVAKTQKGLVAQQEVDDAQGKDLAMEAQVEAAQGALDAAQSQLTQAQAKLKHDQALFDYAKIVAPFDGVVTQRYANQGTLMQAGTSSSQALPLVRLSDEDVYRLVIPVPESYVKYIKIGDPVEVRVPSLDDSIRGKVTRFSVDVNGSTRTMHTEVDVPNTGGKLLPGLYAEAVLTLNQRDSVLVVPPQAITREGDKTSVDVLRPGDKVGIQPVTIGIQMPDYVEIASGLHPGDQVIVSDRGSLKEGDVVKPKPVEPLPYEETSAK
jgi:RND family efflux transporter MFP subunit